MNNNMNFKNFIACVIAFSTVIFIIFLCLIETPKQGIIIKKIYEPPKEKEYSNIITIPNGKSFIYSHSSGIDVDNEDFILKIKYYIKHNGIVIDSNYQII